MNWTGSRTEGLSGEENQTGEWTLEQQVGKQELRALTGRLAVRKGHNPPFGKPRGIVYSGDRRSEGQGWKQI